MKRAVIYYLDDECVIIDKYIIHLLQHLMPFIDKFWIVSPAVLNSEEKKKLNFLDPEFITLAKKKDLHFAYKKAYKTIKQETLLSFDEIIFTTSSLYGPLSPLESLFNKISGNTDIWSIGNFYTRTKKNRWTEHLIPDFLVFRKKVLQTKEFYNCLKLIVYRSSKLQKYLDKKYINKEVFSDFSKEKELSTNPLLFMPKFVIEKYKTPLLSLLTFKSDYNRCFFERGIPAGEEIFSFLRSKAIYDTSMIWENILRTANMSDLKSNLSLNRIVSSKAKNKIRENIKTALVIHIYFEEFIEYIFQYAKQFIESGDIYIRTDTVEKKEIIEKLFFQLSGNSRKIIVKQTANRGRDLSTLLVTFRKEISQYEYVCVIHDKKSAHTLPSALITTWLDKCLTNLLGDSAEYSKNIIDIFEKDPRAGLLFPPPPIHSNFVFFTLSSKLWTKNFEITKDLAKKLGINAPLTKTKAPVAPIGTMFWFRTKALSKILNYEWNMEDFPKEPVGADGTVLHAIERLFPFDAQSAGYYSQWILKDTYAKTELTNLYFGSISAGVYKINKDQAQEMTFSTAAITVVLKNYLKRKLSALLPAKKPKL